MDDLIETLAAGLQARYGHTFDTARALAVGELLKLRAASKMCPRCGSRLDDQAEKTDYRVSAGRLPS